MVTTILTLVFLCNVLLSGEGGELDEEEDDEEIKGEEDTDEGPEEEEGA